MSYYRQKGFEEASVLHGLPIQLSAFFEHIYQQKITDPAAQEFIIKRNPDFSDKKEILEKRIKELENKILDVKKDEEDYRRKKIEEEEKARQYEVQRQILNYNPFLFKILVIIDILLIIAILFAYGVFFMHMFSTPSTKILPPINEFITLVQNFWPAIFLAIIPISFGFALDLIFKSQSKYKIIYMILLGILTFALDFLIAYATHNRITQANEILGLPSTPLFYDTNFWLVIALGPVPVIVLSVFIHYTYKNSKGYIEKQNINPHLFLAKDYREKEMNRKNKAEELKLQLQQLQDQKLQLDNRMITPQLLPKEELDNRINSFYFGWVEWISNFFNQTYENQYHISKQELLEQCKNELQKFMQNSQDFYQKIYRRYNEI